MSDFVLDASLALQWFLEDEADRQYSLAILAALTVKRAAVPTLWVYEVGNGLLMACRRKRISTALVEEFLSRLTALPIRRRRSDTRPTIRIAEHGAKVQADKLRCGIYVFGDEPEPAFGDGRCGLATSRVRCGH